MLMRTRVWFAPVALAAFVLLGSPTERAYAQTAFGVQGSWGSEADVGVGGRLLINIPNVNLEAVASADVFFPGGGVNWVDLNGNVFYHFHLPGSPSVMPYLGGGLNIALISANGSSTEAGLNLGGGVRFPRPGVTPFIEGRAVIASDADQAVLTIGLLFGPTAFR
jgi:hypothetical protein